MLKFVFQVHAFCIAHFDIVVYNCCNCFNGYYVGLRKILLAGYCVNNRRVYAMNFRCLAIRNFHII